MSNYAWVCFNCHLAVRRNGQSENVRCPSCAEQCVCLGYKVPVPLKTKPKEWQRLQHNFYKHKREYLLKKEQQHVRTLHNLEQEITRFETMPEDSGRKETIKYLRRQLEVTRNL
jgi:hypothetical protein